MKYKTKQITVTFVLLMALLSWLSLTILAQEPKPPPANEPTPAPLTIEPTLLPKIEPELLKKFRQSPTEPQAVIIYLTAKADTRAAMSRAKATRLAQRTALVRSLQQTAQASQAGVLAALSQRSRSQTATDIRPLWIINAIAARATLTTVLEIAARSEVAIIRLDDPIQLKLPPPPKTLLEAQAVKPDDTPEWGVAKIRADVVQQVMGIDGRGVVVANLDTGVDWHHPALQRNYRGYNGLNQLPQHEGNWFDALDGATYPVDSNGHGTHTMGTIVGGQGVGVAPGATWIAARAFDNIGSGQNSWIHAAYQWLLAPNDDPSLAPDILNNSWSNINGANLEFEEDLQLLQQAGIFIVFSTGNEGPNSGSVGSPASLPFIFSVGATDINDEVANFSGRGPSPFGDIKPEISAPGKDVLSTWPGGTYIHQDGTSMASPHVAGVAALLLQTSPALSQDLAALARVITSTAVPLGASHPNNEYGWGRIDAYNAVSSIASVGILQGRVTERTIPLANANLTFVARDDASAFNLTTDQSGFYRYGIAADTYNITASAFGYVPSTTFNIVMTNNVVMTQNFSLVPRPQGTLRGTVKARISDEPLSATLIIENTPLTLTANSTDGSYQHNLPVGQYTVTVVMRGYRIIKRVVTVGDGATTEEDFRLETNPTILLIDSGRWQQESQIRYYQDTLDQLLYQYDLWEITRPFSTTKDIPTADLLKEYDIVIWSAPFDSPGYINADQPVVDYLNAGGNLLLSGQDIAYFDGGGGAFGRREYFASHLKANYVADNAGTDGVVGADSGPLAGLSLTIAGDGGANNQQTPDVVAITEPDFAEPLLYYDNGGLAAVGIGICVPYRVIYLGFGFEAINQSANRVAVMQRSLDWLMETPPATAFEVSESEGVQVGRFGDRVTHTLRLRNSGTSADIYQLFSRGNNWTIEPEIPLAEPLDSCQTKVITFGVQIDTDQWHISDTLKITVQSTNRAELNQVITRTSKSPAPVLLVDDDRFYSFAKQYREALEANNIAYDYWLVPKSWSGSTPPSPLTDTLKMYPMVLWYTAYDWSTPLNATEEARLAAYLDSGGRLFFSSQDYIYNLPNNRPSEFAKNYLGVVKHIEDYTSTVIIGERGNEVGAFLGPYQLTFPPGYNNWTDSIRPGPTARVATVGQANQPNGLTNTGQGSTGETWHTLFLAYGPELLAKSDRARLLQRSVGWLSWLGSSTLIADTTEAIDGDNIIYTATVTNDGPVDLRRAYFTATFPTALNPAAISSDLSRLGQDLVWQGPLAKGETKIFKYAAFVNRGTPLGTVAEHEVWLRYEAHQLTFDRMTNHELNFPDLNNSAFLGRADKIIVTRGDILTYTIVLSNNSRVNVPVVTASSILTVPLQLIAAEEPTVGRIVTATRNSVMWAVPMAAHSVVTLSYQAIFSGPADLFIENTAYVDDSVHELIKLTNRMPVQKLNTYLPIIRRHEEAN